MSEDRGPPIIVRKKQVEAEEEHHGGVWKLAFADFMTAMMAFFLVMWLINSTSKETKAAIVQYFNPVQLIDANPAHKGLRDPGQTGLGKSVRPSDSAADGADGPEVALHKEPIKALDEIAKREKQDPTPPSPAKAVRDPFDRAPMNAPPEAPKSLAPKDKAEGLGALQAELERISHQESHAPRIEIARVEEGVLISLTDDANFSMFAVGSIEPRPQLVRIIAQVGKILAAKQGKVEIGGHTDGRSYISRSYDNWRLSADRATMVNYMLVRGGLPASRVARIVGYAERRLKIPGDPLSPMNRRIEILLRGDGN